VFFEPPPVVETTIFAALPEQFRTVRDFEWCDGQPGGKRHPVLEGPVFDAHGNLYFTDIPSGRIFRASRTGSIELVVEYDGWPNGLKFHRDGRLFVADYKNGIMLADIDSGRVEPYLVRANLERFKAINDLAFDDSGTLYFTDQGLSGLNDPSGRVFRVRGDGTVDCLLDNVPSPNGIVMGADGETLFVAATRANAVMRVPFLRSGAAAKVGTFIQLSGGGGPDGIAAMEDGGLAVAHIGLGTVWIFDAAGIPVEQVRSCTGKLTTNIAFGGEDRRSVYITEATGAAILVGHVARPGRALFSQR